MDFVARTRRMLATLLCCGVATHAGTVSPLQPDGHAHKRASSSAVRRPPPASLSPILSRADVFRAGDDVPSATGTPHSLKTDDATGQFSATVTHDVPPVWPPAHQCYRTGANGDSDSNITNDCQPGWEQCQPHAWGSNSPQYHVRDRSCLVGDPNEPVFDPKHKLYHLFYQVGSGRFPGSPASGKWWPRGSLIQGPIQGHVASRDLVR